MERLAIEPGRAPFVGRSREMTLLLGLASRAADGDPQLVVVEGEPGVGKSRLLDEVVTWLGASGWTVLRGDADDLPTATPYGPFVAALRSYSDVHGVDALLGLAGDWAPHLASVLPELGDRGPAVRSRPGDAAVVAEAWAQVIRTIASMGPVVIVLDDLQWADQASRDLLWYLRRRLRGSPLLVVCADRGDETGLDDARHHVGAELARARLATLLLLGRLDPAASRGLVDGLLDGAAGPALVDLVLAEGEGDPFIIEELVRALADGGRLVRTGEAWDLVDDAPIGLPDGVRKALESRLAALEGPAFTILARAAVVGRRFPAAHVAAAAGCDPADADAALAAAARRRFLRAEDDAWFSFAHDKIREALYEGLSPTERRRAHERIVDFLTASSAPVDPMRLAYHALRGERPNRAVGPLLAAAAAALDAGAAADAAERYRAAVEVIRTAGSQVALAGTLLRLGTTLTDAGRYDQAVEALEEALRLAKPGGGAVDAVLAAASLEGLAAVHLAREHPEAAESALRAALDALDGGTDAVHLEARLRVLLLMAHLSVGVTGRLEEGERLLAQARTLATAAGDRRREAEALALLGQAAMHAGDFGGGRRYFDDAAALVDQQWEPGLAADTADGLARLWYWTAEFHRLDLTAAAELDAARRTGDPHRLGWPVFWLAQAAIGLGDWPAARSRAAELTDLGTRLGARRLVGQGHELLGLVHYWTGAFAAACTELESGLEHLRRIGPGTLVYYLGPYGLALLAAGRTAEAEAILAEVRGLADVFPRGSSPRVQAYNLAARITIGLGRADPTLRDELHGAEGQFHWFPVATTLALLSLPGEPAEAARFASLAREVLANGGGTLHLAGVLALEARLAAGRGDAAAAAGLHRRADELVRARHASPVAAGTGRGGANPGAAAPGGPLSPRELEVLALVAGGRTNREIAAALSITEKTAVHHVTHILDKLGVANRAAATSWAVRNGVG